MDKMKNSILSLLAAIGALAGAEGAVVVRPVNPTWEVVVADDVMNPPAAGIDAAPEIQRRIDALAQREGGTLFLRPGTYTVASPVFVRRNVTIKGDYAADEAGQLPEGLKRGVLSQDGINDLLDKNMEIMELLKTVE